jgi:P-type Ca2+ transporter type 2C
MPHRHELAADAVVDRLQTSRQGLSAEVAWRRLAAHGPNVLAEGKRRTPLGIFMRQFKDFMILVLLVAAAISGLIGEATDSLAIIAIIILNAVIGFVQEYRAECAMEALKAMAAPSATVLRGGNIVAIPAAELVPGDVVFLDAGGIVPADLRLLESARLRVDEAALTGESVPVETNVESLEGDTLPLGDRHNMAYKGTIVTYGRGRGIVVATGMAIEFGKIAALLQEAGDGSIRPRVSRAVLRSEIADGRATCGRPASQCRVWRKVMYITMFERIVWRKKPRWLTPSASWLLPWLSAALSCSRHLQQRKSSPP